MAADTSLRILLIEARFYEDIADALAEGALAEIAARGGAVERIAVPGALEIPTALALAAEAGLIPRRAGLGRFDGCVALGCVIRGETTHYETVATESTRWLMHLATTRHIPLGNGILTVENRDQAWARARRDGGDKGADAARACLALIDVGRKFAERGSAGMP